MVAFGWHDRTREDYPGKYWCARDPQPAHNTYLQLDTGGSCVENRFDSIEAALHFDLARSTQAMLCTLNNLLVVFNKT
jgi:hypothetical protein